MVGIVPKSGEVATFLFLVENSTQLHTKVSTY